jgi:ABC-type proline/glycine betaine transport system permease subunit
MAKIEKSRKARKAKQEVIFPLNKTNYSILAIGLAVIVIGYIALSGDTVTSFRQLTIAPILLVLGYCVIIPLGIMYRKKKRVEAPVQPPPAPQA